MKQRRPPRQPAAPIRPSPALVPTTLPGDRLGWRAGAAVFAVALLVRLIVNAELADVVLFRLPQLDALEYLQWAQQIAAGHFPWPVPPPHGLGYPVFLGALLAVAGGSLGMVRTVQALLGAGSALLTAQVGARTLGRRPGLFAGLLAALCGPLAFLDVSLLGEGLLIFLLLLALLAFVALKRPVPRALAAGAALGAATLVRTTAIALLPVFLVSLALERAPRRRTWATAALLTAACLGLVAPVVWQISRVNGAFVPVQGFGGLNFYIGNSPAGDGLPAARLGSGWERLTSEAARSGITGPAAQDRYYRQKALREIAARPGAFARLLAEKALWLVQADEVRDTHSFYFFAASSPLLRWLPGFGLLFSLGACGIGIALSRIRDDRRPVLLLGALAVFAATTVLLVVGSRYRAPLLPVLAMFAGLALTEMIAALRDSLRARRFRTLGILAAAVLAAAGLAHVRRHAPSHNFAEEHALTGASLEGAEDYAGALEAYQHALAADPNAVAAWEGIGRSRIKQGDLQGAEEALRTALRRDPGSPRAHYYLAVVLQQTLRSDEAVRELRSTLALAPDDLPALRTLGGVLLTRGDLDGAETIYRKIAALHEEDAAAQLALARIAGGRNRPQDGIAPARRAAELDPENAEAWLTLARLALDAAGTDGTGGTADLATAAQALDHTEALAGRDNPQVAFTRALLLRRQGRSDAADELLRALLTRAPGFQPAASLLLANAAEHGRRAEAEAFLRGLHPAR